MRLLHTKVIIIAALVIFVSSECPNQELTKNIVDFEIQCLESDPDPHVYIICHSDDWTKFPNVTFNVPSAWIKFQNCSFPPTFNILSILHSMKIKFNTHISFLDTRTMPHRQNFQGLSTSQFLFLDSNATEFPFDLFYGVIITNLFDISYNQLENMPSNFFTDWAKDIRKLNMNHNKLRKIERNDFRRLIEVVTLDLSYNQINEIDSGAFDSLVRLESLKLDSNRLYTLPTGIFHQLSRLTTVQLSENSFDVLPQDLLVNTKHLEYFTIRQNNGTLTTLPEGFFKNLTYLQTVSVENGRLENLPSNLFAGCSSLQFLDLSNNRLRTLPSGLFNDTKNLLTLRIGRNLLESLPSHIFENLRELDTLWMNKNRLTSLTSEELESLESIKDFDASNNNITRIDEQFFVYLKSASHINLSNNLLTVFNVSADTINILKYGEYIDLSNNRISHINLSGLPSEIIVSNSTNDRDEIFSGLVKINLHGNPLHCDCDIADFVRYFNGWNKREQYTIFIGSKFKCASPSKMEGRDIRKIALEELDCMVNTSDPMDACTDTCVCRKYPEKQVLSVDCSYRNLTSTPLTFGKDFGNWSIELNMTGNNLQNAPSLGDPPLANVISLDLSNNNISQVNIDLFSPKLQQLRLHGNGISRLDPAVLEYLASNNSLHSISLHDNKWICDCDARPLLSFVQTKFTSYGFDKITCHGTTQKLHEMSSSELCADLIFIIVSVSLLVAFLAIVVASSLTLYYKYQREIKVWLYSKQWCLWFVTEDELDKDKQYDAFISFSHKDEDFVEKEIVAKLESGPRPYKLCLHYRDWLAGEWIPVQISRSVAESRRTIVVLTPNFLESVWGLMEFRAAHTQALKDGRSRVIVIIYGDIGNIDELDQEMRDYLRLNTYIKWGDPWFWDKVRYALPHGIDSKKYKTVNADIIKYQAVQLTLNNKDTIVDANNGTLVPKFNASTDDSVKLLSTVNDDRGVDSH